MTTQQTKEWFTKHPGYKKKWRINHPGYDKEADKKSALKHPESKKNSRDKFNAEHKKYARDIYRKRRKEVLDHLGGCCTCCGESRYEFLAIDHINGGGKKHIESLHGGHLENWVRKNNYPKGFRVLCHNCNHAIGAYGVCPHQL